MTHIMQRSRFSYRALLLCSEAHRSLAIQWRRLPNLVAGIRLA